MSVYTSKIAAIEAAYEQKKQLQSKIDSLCEDIGNLNKQLVTMLEAQQLLSTVSSNNTNAVIDYITGVINKALAEIFPYDTRRIFIEKNLHGGQKAHIKVKLLTGDGAERDFKTQTGTGLRQLVSNLFVISLIELRKGRRVLLMDELFSGVHPTAKAIAMEIIKIFAGEGFQFVMVEYGADDLGKLYIVEKPNETAKVTPLGESKYNNEVFLFNKPEVMYDSNIYEEVEDTSED